MEITCRTPDVYLCPPLTPASAHSSVRITGFLDLRAEEAGVRIWGLWVHVKIVFCTWAQSGEVSGHTALNSRLVPPSWRSQVVVDWWTWGLFSQRTSGSSWWLSLGRTWSSIGACFVQSAVLQTFVAEARFDSFLATVAGGHGDQFMTHQPRHGLPVC